MSELRGNELFGEIREGGTDMGSEEAPRRELPRGLELEDEERASTNPEQEGVPQDRKPEPQETKNARLLEAVNARVPALGLRASVPAVVAALDDGADINCHDELENTPLHIAAARKDDAVVRELCSRGADVTRKNYIGQTPLAILEELSNKGKDIPYVQIENRLREKMQSAAKAAYVIPPGEFKSGPRPPLHPYDILQGSFSHPAHLATFPNSQLAAQDVAVVAAAAAIIPEDRSESVESRGRVAHDADGAAVPAAAVPRPDASAIAASLHPQVDLSIAEVAALRAAVAAAPSSDASASRSEADDGAGLTNYEWANERLLQALKKLHDAESHGNDLEASALESIRVKVEQALAEGANPNMLVEENQHILFLGMVLAGNKFLDLRFKLAALLISHHAEDYLSFTQNRQTPLLQTLLWDGYEESAFFLIAKGWDINVRHAPENYTALHWALGRGNTQLAQKLIDRGARLDVIDRDGKTPLDIAKELNIINRLKIPSTEIKSDKSEKKIVTPKPEIDADQMLFDAIRAGDIDKVKYALGKGGNPNRFVRAKDGRKHHVSLLTLALYQGNSQSPPSFAVADELRRAGAKFYANARGYSPLYWMVEEDLAPAVNYLINLPGCNIHRATHAGETPLHAAMRNQNEEIIKLLLNAGADPDRENQEGESPRDIAKDMEMEYLLEKCPPLGEAMADGASQPEQSQPILAFADPEQKQSVPRKVIERKSRGQMEAALGSIQPARGVEFSSIRPEPEVAHSSSLHPLLSVASTGPSNQQAEAAVPRAIPEEGERRARSEEIKSGKKRPASTQQDYNGLRFHSRKGGRFVDSGAAEREAAGPAPKRRKEDDALPAFPESGEEPKSP